MEYGSRKVFYMDENHNFVSEEDATVSVIQVFDEDGRMIQEIWRAREPDPIPELGDNETYARIFVDDQGKEVEEELATHIVFRHTVDGVVVSENKYTLG